VDRRDGRDVSHVGTYLEIDRPRRLVFSFTVGGVSSDPDRVTIEIVPLATGSELTLTHEMKPDWAEYVDRTEAGWGMILQGLETAIKPVCNPPHPKRMDRRAPMDEYGTLTATDTVRFERLLPGPIERVWAFLTESDKRATWLAAGPMELRVDGGVELRFHNSELSPTPEIVPEKYRHYEDGGRIGFTARVTRCEPPHVLSHTWDGGGRSRIGGHLRIDPAGQQGAPRPDPPPPRRRGNDAERGRRLAHPPEHPRGPSQR